MTHSTMSLRLLLSQVEELTRELEASTWEQPLAPIPSAYRGELSPEEAADPEKVEDFRRGKEAENIMFAWRERLEDFLRSAQRYANEHDLTSKLEQNAL